MHGVLGEEETRILRLSLGKLHRRTYAEQFGLELFEPHDVEPLDGPVTLGGRRLGPQAMKTHFEEMKMATQRMTTDAVKVDADEPWKNPQAAELDRLTIARWLRALPVSRLCKLAFASQLANYNGCAVGRQSYLGNLAEVKGGGWKGFGPRATSTIAGAATNVWLSNLPMPSARASV